MQPRPDVWSVIRSVLCENFSFGTVKAIAGYGGVDLTQMAHLEQTAGSGGASKSQLLSAVDRQVAKMDDQRRWQFAKIVAEEMLRRQSQVEPELRAALERVGWTLHDGHLVDISILDVSDLPELPSESHADLLKAAIRVRDGDLSGAVSAACAAVDSVTSRIYESKNLGDPTKASFQEKVSRSLIGLDVLGEAQRQLEDLGWEQAKATRFAKNLQGAVNQAAYVMQALRSLMGDVHGTKPILKPLVFDSIKWAGLIVRLLS